MKNETTSRGVGEGGFCGISSCGIHLDYATYQAGVKEALEAGFDRLSCRQVSLWLGGLRSGQKACTLPREAPLVDALAQHLERIGDHALAFRARVELAY